MSFWLYQSDGRTRVALVDLPVATSAADNQGPPPLVLYLGIYYVWSLNFGVYQAQTPYSAQGDLGAPPASVLSNPQN
jgi:hypothetical protein